MTQILATWLPLAVTRLFEPTMTFHATPCCNHGKGMRTTFPTHGKSKISRLQGHVTILVYRIDLFLHTRK